MFDSAPKCTGTSWEDKKSDSDGLREKIFNPYSRFNEDERYMVTTFSRPPGAAFHKM